MNLFQCKILSPDSVIFDGKIWQLSAKIPDGSFSIRNMHADYTAILAPGKIEIAEKPEKRIFFYISDGLLTFKNNQCLIILSQTPQNKDNQDN